MIYYRSSTIRNVIYNRPSILIGTRIRALRIRDDAAAAQGAHAAARPPTGIAPPIGTSPPAGPGPPAGLFPPSGICRQPRDAGVQV